MTQMKVIAPTAISGDFGWERKIVASTVIAWVWVSISTNGWIRDRFSAAVFPVWRCRRIFKSLSGCTP